MSRDLIERADRTVAATYLRHPVLFEKGQGCTLWDSDGKSYTDFVAGIAVCALGHAHPGVARAVCEQAGRLVHVSNLYYTKPMVELAEWLVGHSFADRVFFCNSGAEANEAAIKIARRTFYEKGEPERFRIVAASGSFHGRTMGALSATGQEKIRKGYDPVLEGFDFVPFNDVPAMAGAVGPRTCAVLLEVVQGEGGVRVAEPEYLQAVRSLCDEKGMLLIFDEVQTGLGRTGAMFAHEHYGVVPDVMTLAKALGNGFPIGAMLATEAVASAFGPGAHATTFGGTPLAAAAALEVVRTLEAEDLPGRARRMGDYLRSRLEQLRERHPIVRQVRGKGLLVGLELSVQGAPVVKACMERGYLINCVQDTVLRFVPPLIVETEAIDGLVECLDEVLGELQREP
ncbi:MAG: acetylornithine transaminase [Desulfobacteraceae bacterium]|nr:acetylornithine transaminase [Desulfobacteraceae bacterium]